MSGRSIIFALSVLKMCLTGSRVGRRIDMLARQILGLAVQIFVRYSNPRHLDKLPSLITAHGGLGDCLILAYYLGLSQDCREGNIWLYCPEEHSSALSQVFPSERLLFFKKSKFFTRALEYRNLIGDVNYIGYSPLFEHFLLTFLFKTSSRIGFLYSHSEYLTRKFKRATLVKPNFYQRRKIVGSLCGPSFAEGGDERRRSLPKPESHQNIFLICLDKSPAWRGKGLDEKVVDLIVRGVVDTSATTVALVGLKAEKSVVSSSHIDTLKAKHRVIDLRGNTPLNELMRLVRSCCGVITVEGGLAHICWVYAKAALVLTTFSSGQCFVSKPNQILASTAKCSPCVLENTAPIDIYPPLCPNDYQCQAQFDDEELRQAVRNYINAKSQEYPDL